MSCNPAPLPTREAIRSVLIQRDLDRFIRRDLLTSLPTPIQSIGVGIAVMMMAVGVLIIIETVLWLSGVQTMLLGLVVGLLSFGIPLLLSLAPVAAASGTELLMLRFKPTPHAICTYPIPIFPLNSFTLL